METSNTDRVPSWIAPAFVFLVIALLDWLLSFSGSRFIPWSLTGQATAIIMILAGFCYWPTMRQWASRMPVPHRVIFAVMISGMVLGHYTLSTRTYFPFVSWEIFPFAREEDPVTCDQFIATTASGKKVRLLAEQLFPSIVQIYPLDSYKPEEIEHLGRVMAKVYNEHHADDPVQWIDLFVVAVKLHPPANESRTEPSCELLKRYEISSAQ